MVIAMATATTQDEKLEQCASRLLSTWREETAYLSSSTRMCEHAAYRELISLGSQALPYLFADLERTGDGHLASALASITGVQPVDAADRGSIRKVAASWLRWARGNGCTWQIGFSPDFPA